MCNTTNTKELLNNKELIFLAEFIKAVPFHFVNYNIAKQSCPFVLTWTGSACCCCFLQSCVNYLLNFDMIIKACLCIPAEMYNE